MQLRTLLLLAVLALVCALGACPARAAGYIRINVSPNVILADGVSTATVTAEVRNSSGNPARDGTEVRFYTTAGSITPVAFTSAGVARATITASAVPQAANISVSVGVDQQIVVLPMVSKLVETAVGGRVMRITGKYVAFSEDRHFIQADQQVKLQFRGIEIQCNSAQVDLNQNTVKALGKVQIASDDKTIIGERLWLDLKSFEGYMVALDGRKWFSGYGLTDLPEKPKTLNPDFDLVDLTDSKLMWVGKQANYIINERVQVQGARAYVAGMKTLRMPFHQANLNGGFAETDQYVGVGSQGLTVDVPFYLRMTPGSSTALKVGYGARTGGIGYFSRNNGLSVDLVQKYGFVGASEGEAQLTNMASLDKWGFFWNHTQQFNQRTRLVSTVQFPEHRDIYGQFSFTSGLPVGTVHMSAAGAMPRSGQLAKTLSFAFETKPKPLADGKLSLTGEVSSFWRDAQRFRIAPGLKVAVNNTQYQAAGLRLRAAPAKLGHGFTLESSAVMRAVVGNVNTGFGPGLEANLRRQLPRNGSLSLGLNYNPLTTFSDILPQGRTNATYNVVFPVTSKLRVAAFGSMALDGPNQNSILQLSYEFAPKWRLEMLHTLFKFGGFNDFDYQIGFARSIGTRDLAVYWSRKEHKFLFEFGVARF